MNAERFPIDFDRLEKGSVVTVAEVERIYGVKQGTDKYNLKALVLGEAIERALEGRGEHVTVKCEKGNLVVLRDAEASKYNASEAMRHLRGMERRHRQMGRVDVSELTAAQRMEHNRRHLIIGSMLLAAAKARKMTVATLVHKRRTPGLLPQGGEDKVKDEG
jgi:hypothetical protein